MTRLAYMPYSHSVAMMLLWALLAWALFAVGLRRAALGLALGLAVGSHLVLDLATHLPDIALAPGLESIKLGSGLYGIPLLAFVLETRLWHCMLVDIQGALVAAGRHRDLQLDQSALVLRGSRDGACFD